MTSRGYVSIVLVSAGLLAGTLPRAAWAYIQNLPANVSEDVLSETVPTAFPPNELESEDFALEWVGTPLAGVQVELERRSVMWVRVVNTLVLPRARILVTARDVDGGRVSNAGFSQPFKVDAEARTGRAEVPIALISGERNPIDIAVVRHGPGGKTAFGKLVVRFKPREPAAAPRVVLDSSCSYFGVTFDSTGPRDQDAHQDWAYVGCRLVDAAGENYRIPSLEVLVYWDNVGQTIRVGGADTPSSSPSIWALRLRSDPGKIELGAGDHHVAIRYSIPERLHRGSVGLGIGPYSFTFLGNGANVVNWVAMPTLYSSLFITESMRVVAFDATSLNDQSITDFGVYLNTEYIRTVDRRIAIYLMLGVHAIGFRQGVYYFHFGAPQGAEVIYTDFLMRGRNLALGAFVYPEIDGKAYYNTWLRWGSGRMFYEFNYISWQEKFGDSQFSSRALGVSIGVPLTFLRFL